MTNINNIKSVIINRISSDITKVQDTADYEKTGFSGFPAVTIFCSGNENDYESTSDNLRTFTFIIRIHEQLGKIPQLDAVSDNAKQRAERILGDVVSEIIDSFDKYYTLGGAVDICKATPSRWGYAEIPEGWARIAEIKIECKKSFDITS